MRVLEGVFAEHDSIKCQVVVLRVLVEKTTALWLRLQAVGRGVRVAVRVEGDENHASVTMIVPHEGRGGR